MLEATYNLFVKVVSLSAMASVLSLMILVVRNVFKDRLRPTWTYLLWIPLVVRLVIPWSPESAFSIFNMLPVENEAVQTATVIPSVQSNVETTSSSRTPSRELGLEANSGAEATLFLSETETKDSVEPANPALPLQSGGSDVSLANDTKWTLLHLLALVWQIGRAHV